MQLQLIVIIGVVAAFALTEGWLVAPSPAEPEFECGYMILKPAAPDAVHSPEIETDMHTYMQPDCVFGATKSPTPEGLCSPEIHMPIA
jgi:hypothetical protein